MGKKKNQNKDMKRKAKNQATMKLENGEQKMRPTSRHETNTKKKLRSRRQETTTWEVFLNCGCSCDINRTRLKKIKMLL